MRRGHMVSKQIKELRKYARKWSEWNGFKAAMPVLPSTNIRLLYSAADTIEALDRSAGKWIEEIAGNGWNEWVNLTCDQCGAKFEKAGAWLYCPMCGAKMHSGEVNDK